jgi:poly(A) polymerase
VSGADPGRAPAAPRRLETAPWLAGDELRAVLAALSARGHQARVVGGAVRNALLGAPITDIDVATTATPEEVEALAAAARLATVPTGRDHGTITVLAGRHAFEVTTLRRDVETFGRHAVVAFTTDWAEDAGRRDFTINALYADGDGTLHDPTGEGLADLAAGRVRFIGDAVQRIREDRLRILRFFRFTAEYAAGGPDAGGLAACAAEQRGLQDLSAERIRAELVKLLAAPGSVDAIGAMFDHGLLSPILGAAPQPALFGRAAAIEASNGLAPDPMRRLALLAVHVADDVARLALRLRLANAEQAALADTAAAWSSGAARLPTDRAAAEALLYRRGRDAYLSAIVAAGARSGVAPGDPVLARWIALPARWSPPAFPLSGRDVLAAGVAPGPEVGRLLGTLEDAWVAARFALTREALLAALATLVRRG